MKASCATRLTMLLGICAVSGSQAFGISSLLDRMEITDPSVSARVLCVVENGSCYIDTGISPGINLWDLPTGPYLDGNGSSYVHTSSTAAGECPAGHGTFEDFHFWRVSTDGTAQRLFRIIGSCHNSPFGVAREVTWFEATRIDAVNGLAIIHANSFLYANGGNHYETIREVIEVSGLPRLLDVVLSYQPPASLSFNAPARPEGLSGADTYSVYSGNVAAASSLASALPLDCTVPDGRAPIPGEILTVPDTTPTPPPGEVTYFLVAANYQGQRRAGRKSMGGMLRGRDPANLAACNPSEVHQ